MHAKPVTVAVVVATATGFLALSPPALADTGAVYFDGSENAAAGDPNHLFNSLS